jgi:hypothetical protein
MSSLVGSGSSGLELGSKWSAGSSIIGLLIANTIGSFSLLLKFVPVLGFIV